MEKSQCYICLEHCVGEYSPCECNIPVHAECLERFMQSDGRIECSVCKSPLEVISFELDIEDMPDVVLRPRIPRRRFGVYVCIAMYYFLLYCVTGWFGKLMHLLASEDPVAFDVDFFDVFTPLHILCAFAVSTMAFCIYQWGAYQAQ